MKLKISATFMIFIFFVALTGCSKKDDGTKSGDTDSKKDSKLSVDNPFHVEFKIAGTVNGTVDAIYYKTKARTQSNIDIGGQKMSATAYYTGGDTMFIVSEMMGIKTGMKINKSDYGKKEGEIDAITFKDQLKNMDKIGTEEILEKKCDIYKAKDGKFQISIYNEMVPLKFSTGDGKMVMEATKFDTDVKVDENTFTPPTDVKYMDTGDMMKDLKNPKDINNLKDKAKEYEDLMKKYNK